MTPQEESKRWIRVGLEAHFSVWGPDVHEQGRHWKVVDAECEEIAICATEEMAEILVAALECYDAEMMRIELA